MIRRSRPAAWFRSLRLCRTEATNAHSQQVGEAEVEQDIAEHVVPVSMPNEITPGKCRDDDQQGASSITPKQRGKFLTPLDSRLCGWEGMGRL